MKRTLASLAVGLVFCFPNIAEAKPVTFTAQMKGYGGPGAYLVMYVTDAQNRYKGTLWVSGRKAKYYRHFRNWTRSTRGAGGNVDGITGASVTSGRTLQVTLNLSDALFDAGYKLHIDTSVENFGDAPSEVVVPLETKRAGKAVQGRQFIRSFSYKM